MNTAKEDERSEIEALLPWHAAGTLSQRDAQRVEAALASDAKLAEQYELVREELGETIYLNESLGAPSPRAMETLFAKIDAEPVRAPSFNLGARISGFFANLAPRTLAWSASAAAIAILLQAGLIAGFVLTRTGGPGYQTASAPANDVAAGTFAMIRFAPQASAADITKFLETNKLKIADGPSVGGLYRVRIAGTKLPKTEVGRVIKTLQLDPVVGLIVTIE
ncbi:MAG TPA: hypothetical protein VEJ37_04685 [Xanthobacteraceae bacterium]|nr:hypothetical protein [Xanthobacteraceae bacterium]